MELRPQQIKALSAIKEFLADSTLSVFILKGYAGTGKTTMIKAILPELDDLGKTTILMAPTGRAAKVLKEKTSTEDRYVEAYTIHKTIYESSIFGEKVHDDKGKLIIQQNKTYDSIDRANGVDDFQIWFGIRKSPSSPNKTVYIIDEASMISSRKITDEILHFGTDVVLDDLLTFANPLKGGKLIFVGDPAQLPPVGDNKSAALDESYFTAKGLKTATYELTEVLRQLGGSAILRNAMKVRNLMLAKYRNSLEFERVPDEVEDIEQVRIVSSFVERQPTPIIGDSIVICYSNNKAFEYNKSIRQEYFPLVSTPQTRDIIQVVKNNYVYALLNGDFAQITKVSNSVETLSASVWTNVNGEKKRVKVDLLFRDIALLTDDGREIECKIVDNLLRNSHASLTHLEATAIYVNFVMRHPELRNDAYKRRQALLNDPYFNALHVKYGYAITCHKAQGGDWNTVYVDYGGRTGLDDDSLRWNYTATTRAIQHLYGVNMPRITLFDKLRFMQIVRVKKPAKDALSLAEMGDVDILPINATNAQKAKYKSIKTYLELVGFEIEKVVVYPYKDRYTIKTLDGIALDYDCNYTASGIYSKYTPLTPGIYDAVILPALASDCEYDYCINYTPPTPFLTVLHYNVCSLCDELDITITNIVLQESNYNVVYYLKTSGNFSSVTFFFNANGFISYGLPSSDIGESDEKLQKLINRMQ